MLDTMFGDKMKTTTHTSNSVKDKVASCTLKGVMRKTTAEIAEGASSYTQCG